MWLALVLIVVAARRGCKAGGSNCDVLLVQGTCCKAANAWQVQQARRAFACFSPCKTVLQSCAGPWRSSGSMPSRTMHTKQPLHHHVSVDLVLSPLQVQATACRRLSFAVCAPSVQVLHGRDGRSRCAALSCCTSEIERSRKCQTDAHNNRPPTADARHPEPNGSGRRSRPAHWTALPGDFTAPTCFGGYVPGTNKARPGETSRLSKSP